MEQDLHSNCTFYTFSACELIGRGGRGKDKHMEETWREDKGRRIKGKKGASEGGRKGKKERWRETQEGGD